MTAAIFNPTIIHSTPAGFEQGCTSNGGCPGRDVGLTCKTAASRYHSDYTYKKQVDTGWSPEQILAADGAAAVTEAMTAKAERQAARSAADRRAARKRAALDKPPVPRVYTAPREFGHGTKYGYRKGCKTDEMCPNEGDQTCRAVLAAYDRARHKSKGLPNRKVLAHGTESGYKNFPCRRDANCPAEISCAEVARTADRNRRHAREARKANA